MPWGKPGPIRLPDDADERAGLVQAHLRGLPATVTYCPADEAPREVDLPALRLFALCPGDDGLCRWLGVDLDAASGHGEAGLVDPAAAQRTLAERAYELGIGDGLLVSPSRSGKGRHVWLVLPGPTPLPDACLALAAWAAAAFHIAEQDAPDNGRHAFSMGNGGIAKPGQAGAVELIPRGGNRPRLGWGLALPRGFVDLFDGKPANASPCPSLPAWQRFIGFARADLARKTSPARPQRRPVLRSAADPILRAHPETKSLLASSVAPGNRNRATYRATCNLIGLGVDPAEAARLVREGAMACGLPENEIRTAIESALKTKGGR